LRDLIRKVTVARSSTAAVYDAFAPYYDDFTSASDYEAWARETLALARLHGLRGERLLDLACGTGKSFMPFYERGFSITACDSSAGMLAEAARRAPDARLVHADIRALPALGQFDLVTCIDDSLNYLLDEDELATVFAGIKASLAPGGVAVFDLNTLLAYRTTFACHSVTESGETVFAWRGSSTPDAAPGCEARAQLDVFAPAGDGGYSRVTTEHRQRHFPGERVAALLAAAGLECRSARGVLADCSLVEPGDESAHHKVLYVATRREGGDAE
jgi:SAM-dependent methyltransferase